MLDVFRGLKNLIKVNYIHIDSPVFRLHYSITVILLVSFSLIVTTRQYVGNPIDCIHTKDIPEDVLNTYCWIHSTYTLKSFFTKKVGVEVPYPGIGNSREKGKEDPEDKKIYKYYQWVCFCLFFQAPGPPLPWEGVLDASKHGPVCPHFDLLITKAIAPNTDEDCLYLNVYTPNVKSDRLAPVMFWIHGGGFVCGSGNDDLYGPDFLVEKGVVLVTFNYRLDALGFLCLDTEEVPGNAGMKDQVAALRWVKENIHNFGGDPKNVTIFGESAGAASVGFHLVSPMSKGLFKRAILQSGTFNCDWANAYLPRDKAFILGKKLGFTTTDPTALFEYLQSVPVEKLIFVPVSVTLYENLVEMNLPFTIVNEKSFGSNEPFINKDVVGNLESINDVEILLGYTATEGIIYMQYFDKLLEILDTLLEYLVPRELAQKNSLDRQIEIGRKIKDHYFSGGPVTKEKTNEVVKYLSEFNFNYNVIRLLKSFKSKCTSTAYLYRFSFPSDKSITGPITSVLNPSNLEGVCHFEDLLYLFYMPLLNLPSKKPSESNSYYRTVDHMTALWTNFAKYGNPTPDNSLGVKWPPYTLDKEEYLDIGKDLVPGHHLDKENMDFWEHLYRTFNNVPYEHALQLNKSKL